MAGGKLEVQIGADISDFEKKIKEVEFDIKELSKVKLDRLKVGLDTSEINSQIKDAKASLNSLKTTVKDTGGSFTAMTPKVANAGNTLTQFSRIAQDAPYGIIGIGNNITATAESFSYLKAQTGSTGGALKALGSSLAGTGGILLGVSLLTTGFTLLAQSGLSVGDVIDKITGKFNAARAEMQKVNEEAAKQSGSEIASMKALVSVAQDDTKSRQDRLIAVKELQKEFPAYFGNLSQEKILNGNLTSVTKELTAAITARAKASAYASKIGDLAAEELKLNYKLIKAKEDLAIAEKEVAKDVAKTVKNMSDETAAATQGGVASAISRNSIRNDLREIRADLAKNKASQDIYTKAIENTTSASIKLNQDPEKAPKVLKPKKEKGKKFEFEPAFIAPFVSTISGLGSTMDGFADRSAEAFSRATANVKKGTDEMTALLLEFNNSANDLIVNTIAGTFSQLGDAIGNAIATGGDVLSAIGQTIIQAFAGFLSSMGDLLIKYGTLAVLKGKLDVAIAAGGPISIGAGIAAIAVGIALKAAGAAIGSYSSSGGRSGSSASGAGANNSSFTSSGFGGGNGGGTVVFEIAGNKLLGVLNNTIGSNKRLGGAIGLG